MQSVLDAAASCVQFGAAASVHVQQQELNCKCSDSDSTLQNRLSSSRQLPRVCDCGSVRARICALWSAASHMAVT